MTAPARFRYLALGDSYTIGEGVTPTEAFPFQLADQLNTDTAPGVTVIARTGWTTDELMGAVAEQDLPNTFDLVTLLIGVNNQYRGYSLTVYREEFKALLKRAIQFAGDQRNRVVVLSIPDWGVTPFAKKESRTAAQISSEIERFNSINREESEREGVVYINITPVSRQAFTDPTLLAPDGLHPSGRMYSLWVGQMLSCPAFPDIFFKDKPVAKNKLKP
ncbi:MAG TPA: SGNH/GDSL hydrolase family protein [Sphingobacteriaceae bacterium]